MTPRHVAIPLPQRGKKRNGDSCKSSEGREMFFWNSLVASLFAATLISSAAGAATIAEGSGNFSDDWTTPTVIGNGTTDVSGSGAPEWMGGDRFDVFHFSGLVPGATSVVIDFFLTKPYPADAYANGGGSVYYSYVPFTGSFYVDQGDGTVLGSQDLLAGVFDVTYNPWDAGNPNSQGTSTFEFDLDGEFSGDLFMALDFTYGKVSYNINSPAWASSDTSSAANPVPLPGTAWLMLAAISGFGLLAARRKHA